MNNGNAAPQANPAIGDAAQRQAELGEEWLAFAKEQFQVSNDRQTELDALTKRVTEHQLGVSERQETNAIKDRARYDDVFQPIEDQFIDEATNYGSAEQQDQAASEAAADVTRATADAKQQAERHAMGLGINPNSGRFAGIDKAGELTTGLATAGAKNNARTLVRDKGLALKGDVVNLGRGLPTQSASAASLGLSAGSSAIGLNQANQNLFNSSTGIVGQGYGGAIGGAAGQAATLSADFKNQSAAYNTQQEQSAANWGGIGEFAGGVTGLLLSSKKAKTNKKTIKDDAALDAVRKLDVEEWDYKPGEADGGHHVGPYAEDFKKHTGIGSGETIPIQDMVGITMRAVQDLDRKVSKTKQAA